MATGKVSFAAHIEGLDLKQVDAGSCDPSVKKISIQTENETTLAIDFELLDVFSTQDAISVVGPLIESLISKVSYEFDCPIGEPRFTGMSLPTDASGSHHQVLGETVCLNDLVADTLKPNEKKREKLKRSLELPLAETDAYLSLYRFCIGQKDPLARFLSFYHLVHIIAADEQESQISVDRAIAQIEPNVEWTVKPNTRGKKLETKFTRLRNEIAHRRPGKTLEETRQEIEENVDALRGIAKKLVYQKFEIG
ncbi:MAG: hypothetical protein QG577_910 [Thermodesulfobacteriota bacterium]|nr:hypothetical protein [Thermodesulfobacteriota bacterium]